ncbi:hypothetical protein B0H66DRAFT_538311 [Apodospora peruviana]|uniref:Myb-like domain-containing protein n=1 Tax=Apodospora peruviana TaxID=516989 RepID=A0AAE0HV05_9PEZI|nr:hypothetical protein B0H66DRAFT_538311 [Apodospora peruviana]
MCFTLIEQCPCCRVTTTNARFFSCDQSCGVKNEKHFIALTDRTRLAKFKCAGQNCPLNPEVARAAKAEFLELLNVNGITADDEMTEVKTESTKIDLPVQGHAANKSINKKRRRSESKAKTPTFTPGPSTGLVNHHDSEGSTSGNVADDENDGSPGSSSPSPTALTRAAKRKRLPKSRSTPSFRAKHDVLHDDMPEPYRTQVVDLTNRIKARRAAMTPPTVEDLAMSRPPAQWLAEENELLWILRTHLDVPFKQIEEQFLTGRSKGAIEHRHMFQRQGKVMGYPPKDYKPTRANKDRLTI